MQFLGLLENLITIPTELKITYQVFQLVGSTEANSLEGKISNESPVGKALIGKKVGDVVAVETQAGVIEYEVLKINRSV